MQVRITFKAYLTCRKRPNPPGIEVLSFSFFRFIQDYKYNLKQSVLNEKERFKIGLLFYIHPLCVYIYSLYG